MTTPAVPFSPNLADAAGFLAFARGVIAGDARALRRTVDMRSTIPQTEDVLKELVSESLLLDFADQGWQIHIEEECVSLMPPTALAGDRLAEKARIRQAQLVERDEHLRKRPVSEFVASMEKRRLGQNGWHSIFSLMRDGRDLSARLRQLADSPEDPSSRFLLKQVITPYIQIAEPGTTCEHTGLDLGDIWRYFRLTWVNAPKSVPGRSMMILVRDASAPNHPIIGIAALGSSVVQQQLRDKWIGWDADTFADGLSEKPTIKQGRWLLDCVEGHIAALYSKDLIREGIISRRELRSPTSESIDRLRTEGVSSRKKHGQNSRAAHHKRAAGDWEAEVKTHLFRAKRCESLARLLTIRRTFLEAGLINGSGSEVAAACAQRAFRSAVGQLIRINKAEHVGINMMDITVCGAVAPYTHLLGGKLISTLLCSPEVVQAYKDRYSNHESIIASSMRGASVHREPRLVLLATTSLYGVGASQYNRIRIPSEALGCQPGEHIRYEELGLSIGFGSFHVSPKTTLLMDTLLARSRDGRKVNRIFGEGVNPRMRMIRQAMELLDLPSNALLLHGNKRVIYGIPLARNFREVLLGLADRPSYLLPLSNPKEGTKALVSFWLRRWLVPRIRRPGILDKVAEHTLSYPVEHGARVVTLEPEPEDEATTF